MNRRGTSIRRVPAIELQPHKPSVTFADPIIEPASTNTAFPPVTQVQGHQNALFTIPEKPSPSVPAFRGSFRDRSSLLSSINRDSTCLTSILETSPPRATDVESKPAVSSISEAKVQPEVKPVNNQKVNDGLFRLKIVFDPLTTLQLSTEDGKSVITLSSKSPSIKVRTI